MSDTYSVGQLQRKAKNAIAREFRGQVWVSGEIKSFREHRGNLYITLVEPGENADGGDTSLDVAAWPRKAALIHAQLIEADVTLAAGRQVRIAGNVTLSKLGRLMVEMSSLDIEALLGNQAAEKQKLYVALEREGLLNTNKRRLMPLVPLRIGLVTSEGSEGCNDFLGQLHRSAYGFEVTLVHSPVQGPAASVALARAITQLHASQVDLIAVVRGGGGELDAFDKEPVARAIATSPLPVWIGVGHTGDHSVADDVAQRAFVTPTECGQAIVSRVTEFDNRVAVVASRLCASASKLVVSRQSELNYRASHLRSAATRNLDIAKTQLVNLQYEVQTTTVEVLNLNNERARELGQRIATLIDRPAEKAGIQLEYIKRHLRAVDPRRPLERGYSMTHTANGVLVTDPKQLTDGDMILTELARGKLRSVVEAGESQ